MKYNTPNTYHTSSTKYKIYYNTKYITVHTVPYIQYNTTYITIQTVIYNTVLTIYKTQYKQCNTNNATENTMRTMQCKVQYTEYHTDNPTNRHNAQ